MPLTSWATPVIQWLGQSEAISRELANLLNLNLSSDCRLQLAYMKLESLVIAHQHGAVNTFPDLVHTARQAMGVGGA